MRAGHHAAWAALPGLRTRDKATVPDPHSKTPRETPLVDRDDVEYSRTYILDKSGNMTQFERRQAGAFEITDEMISAGLDALWSLDVAEDEHERIVREIYAAMASQSGAGGSHRRGVFARLRKSSGEHHY
jgi:hypothetical protein